jgi:hypothetical protein
MNNLRKVIEEISTGSKNERLTRAIKNRMPVSFYYNGPKGKVLSGRRIKAEFVAIGLTKKGNLVARGWVQPPSVSKRGFEKHGWRLFMLSRMSGIQIYEDETFNVKRPKLNPDGDKSLSVVYVTSKWGEIPELPQPTEPEVEPIEPEDTMEPEVEPTEPEDTIEPEVEPTEPEDTMEPEPELPSPKPKEKPPITPEPEIDFASEVYDGLKNKIQDIDGQKRITPDDFNFAMDNLRRKKTKDWAMRKKEMGSNSNPGEGTRRRIEKDSEIELFNILKKNNVIIGTSPLQESIKRIKTLIFF